MEHIVLMGVAGCGKTSVGEALAPVIGADFIDGDALHPADNIAKMSRGEPLDDADRWPWLEKVGFAFRDAEHPLIIGCSALKRVYRDAIIGAAGGQVCFVHLAGSRALIEQRMAGRQGHFMPVSLLDSQFAALEPPGADEMSVTADIALDMPALVASIKTQLEEFKA